MVSLDAPRWVAPADLAPEWEAPEWVAAWADLEWARPVADLALVVVDRGWVDLRVVAMEMLAEGPPVEVAQRDVPKVDRAAVIGVVRKVDLVMVTADLIVDLRVIAVATVTKTIRSR